ncbi:hypothetical protein QJS10_CPA08g01749 [Acorus calamus]|uniref:Uncharacterized protein n=1 Tax=Acorus calamus TaxID=4465 RepID=A0AAV9EGL0_ACOCL|nr:hypothetical protein QJS10_CPA08g01749 [Acorus calamus]
MTGCMASSSFIILFISFLRHTNSIAWTATTEPILVTKPPRMRSAMICCSLLFVVDFFFWWWLNLLDQRDFTSLSFITKKINTGIPLVMNIKLPSLHNSQVRKAREVSSEDFLIH